MFVLPSSADVRRAYIEENLTPRQRVYVFYPYDEEVEGYACGLSAVAISQGSVKGSLHVQEFIGLVSSYIDEDGRTNVKAIPYQDNPEVAKYHGFIHGFDGSVPSPYEDYRSNEQAVRDYMEGYRTGKETWEKVKDLREKTTERKELEVAA